MMRLDVSPTPIGLIPGRLSRAMSRHATKADKPLGSTKLEDIRLAVEARASHSSVDSDLNDVHRRLNAAASSPEGPAAPSIRSAVLQMSCPSILSNRIGSGSVVSSSGVMIDVCCSCCGGGCFFWSASRRAGSRVVRL